MAGKRRGKKGGQTSPDFPSKPLTICVESGGGTSNDRILADRQHLLTIFPPEVWLLITEQLDNDSLEHLSNSSLFLRQLLHPQRVRFMFQNVWRILGSSRHTEKFRKEDESYDFSPLLRLRLVCHSWNKAFDSFCQLHPAKFQLKNETRSGCPIFRDSFWVHIPKQNEGGIMSLENYLSYVSSARNPFFARSVAILIPKMSGNENLWNKTLDILTTNGHHIWHCAIHFNCNYEHQPVQSPAAVYSYVRSILERVPNSKTLRVNLGNCNEITADQLSELQNEISSGPLPCLEHLELLKTSYVTTPIFQQLIRQNSHISTLEISRGRHHADYDIYNAPLPNLSKLSIYFESEEDLLKLTNPQVNWPLTKLCLDFYGTGRDFSDWQTVFSVLHDKFRNTLTHLELFPPRNLTASLIYQLDLPKLTHLSIQNVQAIPCLDFLLPMRHSLTNLQILTGMLLEKQETALTMAEQMEEKSVIKGFGCAKRALKSNIWQVLSNLDFLSFRCRFDKGFIYVLEGSRKQPNNDVFSCRRLWPVSFYKNR